ncbi:pentapeptide repeat-containing protein [Aeromonas caviae]|uniref:pentapeptide repeat-containing protein n=1 Tax=Aeromonas caviae TaxID=648 RepID=UPI002B460003|nr:pentapeptide repeat-containing protein [Aeromonas caviae]
MSTTSNQVDFFQIHGHENTNYSGRILLDVGGKNIIFDSCDFSYAVIERGYFHQATFKNCKFIGTRFISCNFRSTKIEMCDFRYATFIGTVIPINEISSNFPYEPNQRRDLIQSLRANAISIGDYQTNNDLLSLELKATTQHHLNIVKRPHSYYLRKYTGIDRIKSLLKYLGLKFEDLVWGYGLSPQRLIIFALSIITVTAAILSWQEISLDSSMYEIYSLFTNNFANSLFALLDLALVPSDSVNKHNVIFACIVIFRVTILGLLVSVLYRRYAR